MRIISFILLLTAVTFANSAAAELTIPPFEAKLVLNKYGINAAKGVMSFYPQDGDYVYSLDAKASGIVAAFTDAEINQKTTLSYQKDAFRPISYQYRQSGDDKPRDIDYTFDWDNKLAVGTYRNQKKSIKLTNDTQEVFSLPIIIMNDLKQERIPTEYTVVNKDKVLTYQCDVIGEERISTNLGTFDTLKVERRSEKSNKMVKMWFAKDLHYLPIKIEEFKDGQSNQVLTVSKVDWLDTP